MLPGGRDVQSRRAQAETVWTMSQRGGDAIYFDCANPHTYRRNGRSRCAAIVVVTGYEKSRDRQRLRMPRTVLSTKEDSKLAGLADFDVKLSCGRSKFQSEQSVNALLLIGDRFAIPIFDASAWSCLFCPEKSARFLRRTGYDRNCNWTVKSDAGYLARDDGQPAHAFVDTALSFFIKLRNVSGIYHDANRRPSH